MKIKTILFLAGSLFSLIATANAQTNEFTYEGRLTDTGTPTATYDFEFRLCVALAECSKPLESMQRLGVAVSNGVFNVKLNFAAANFNGDDRFLEIGVKHPAEPKYTTLDPRQKITSTPYSVRALNAGVADDSLSFGGLGTGDFVRNATKQQIANFNVSGSGIIGGSLGLGVTPQAGLKFDFGGNGRFQTSNGNINFGTPNSELGMSFTNSFRADIRLDSFGRLNLATNFGPGIPSSANGISISADGFIGIGTLPLNTSKLRVIGTSNYGVYAESPNGIGVYGESLGASSGVYGLSSGGAGVRGVSTNGYGVHGESINSYAGYFSGKVRITTFPFAASSGQVCFNAAGDVLQCGASSLRLKKNIQMFRGGLHLIKKFNPIGFDWIDGSGYDIGLAAEDVAKIDPFFVLTNAKGEVQGVKYERLNILLINAVKEQQEQIERQQRQIDALTQIVCQSNPETVICNNVK